MKLSASLKLAVPLFAMMLVSGCGGGGSPIGNPEVTYGLIHWWKFNGDATDSAGSLNASPIGPVSYAPAPPGQGMAFDGSTTGINLPVTPDMQFQGSFSISAWVELNAYIDPGNIWSTVIFCGDDRPGLDPFFIQVYTDGTLQFESCSATAALGINATQRFPLHQFVHVTGTYNKAAGIQRLYINGQLDAENLQVPNLTPVVQLDRTQKPNVGIGVNNGFPGDALDMGWNGIISDLRVYNRALSPSEVQSIYARGKAGTY